MQNWDERANMSSYYKGEFFYTITPLPLYYKRRILLTEHLNYYVKQSKSILDFGCGDGWYIHYFIENNKELNNIIFEGLDVSSEMVKLAREKNKGVNIYRSDCGISFDDKYSLVYSIAVFAHIDNQNLISLFKGIYKSLNIKGRFILFEQVSEVRYAGDTFIRREISEYISNLKAVGFSIEQVKLFDFPAHRFFERRIAKFYYKYFSKGKNNIEKRLNANKNRLFRFLSYFFILLDRNPVVEKYSGFGNVLIIAIKD